MAGLHRALSNSLSALETIERRAGCFDRFSPLFADPAALRVRNQDRLQRTRLVSAMAHRPWWKTVSNPQIENDAHRGGSREVQTFGSKRTRWTCFQDHQRSEGHSRRKNPSKTRDRRTSAALERSSRRHGTCRSPTTTLSRSRSMYNLAASPYGYQTRHHLHLAGLQVS